LRAHVITRNVFGLAELHDRINTLDLEIPSPLQIELHQHVRGVLRRQVLWFLRTDPDALDIGRFVDAYGPGVAELGGRCEEWLTGLDLAACSELKARYAGSGVPQDVASRVADLLPLQAGCDIIDVSSHWAMPLIETARAYSEIGAALGLDRLRAAAGSIRGAEHWERLANRRLLEDMFRLQRALAHAAIGQAILEGGTGLEGPVIVGRWTEVHDGAVRRTVGLVTELESAGQWTTAKLSLAVQQFRDLAEGPAGRDDTHHGAEA
jgi:glutamate dehydrogenase